MVQAILAGRKTQTRRLIDPQPATFITALSWGKHVSHCPEDCSEDQHVKTFFNDKSKWQAGDFLWVRENWQLKCWDFEEGTMRVGFETGEAINCLAHDPGEDSMWLLNKVEQLERRGYIKTDPKDKDRFVFTDKKQPFKPSIHMPKEAARIWLQVENVRVERLKEISEDDAIAEGVEKVDDGPFPWKHYGDCNTFCSDARTSFRSLWEEINGFNSWQANPFIWAINFIVLSTTGKPDYKQLKAV
jgi:hypothetical protein